MRHYKLQGEVVGPIWWPVGEECTKSFSVEFARTDDNLPHPWARQADTLRDVLLHVTNDGDFQNASILWATLTVIDTPRAGKRIERFVELKGKDTNADCWAS